MNNLTKDPLAPKCGASDQRNVEYNSSFSPKKFFDALVDNPSPVIFDVGAHRGESIDFFRSIYPESIIYTFEPSPDNFEELLNKTLSYENVFPFNLALGNSDSFATFYKQDITHLGGLHPINRESKDSLGYAKKAKNTPINVSLNKLDTFCANNGISFIDILKIDTQGYEYEVLQGARKNLSNIRCVTVEISLYDFYESKNRSPLLNIEQLMFDAGFTLWDISKISKNPKSLRTDWIEAVYRNIKLTPRSPNTLQTS
jgi:FkbM family methyltransferase